MKINLSAKDALRFDLTSLPATRVDTGSRSGGCFMIVFALLWGGLPTAALIGMLTHEGFKVEQLPILLFTVIGAGLLLAGLKLATSRTETVIGPAEVLIRKRSLFGAGEWRTPLEQYQGVLSRTEYHSGGKNRSSYTLHIVELHHPDKARVVRLYQSRSEAGFRNEWESAARALSLPALTRGEDGRIEARAVEDLNRPVRELVREGKLAVAFDPTRPPAGVLFRAEGDTLEITVQRKGGWGGLIFMLIPGAMIYAGFFLPKAPVMLGVVGLIFALVFIAGLVWWIVAREQLLVSREAVAVRHMTRWGPTAGRRLEAGAIEGVRVGRPREGTAPAVVIESDTGSLTFGLGLKPEAMQWVRDCILHVLAS